MVDIVNLVVNARKQPSIRSVVGAFSLISMLELSGELEALTGGRRKELLTARQAPI
jgi:hypothetical protein